MGVHKSTISRELKRNITFVSTALGLGNINRIMPKVTPKKGIEKKISGLNLPKN